MAGKSIRKSLKNNSRCNRKLKRSLKFGVGRYEGVIKSIKFKLTQSKKEAIEVLMYNPETGMSFTYVFLLGNSSGERLIDTLLDIYGSDEAELEELVGLVVGFETELNGTYINLKSFYEVDTEFEEEMEEEIDEDSEDYDYDDEFEEE